MIDWKSKLTSRKFWAAVCALVTNLVLVFGGNQETAVKMTALIMAGAAVVAYIIGEGLIDAAAAGTDFDTWELTDEMKPPEEDGEETE